MRKKLRKRLRKSLQLKKQDKAWTALRSKKNFTAIVSSVMVACLILTAAAQIGMNMYSGAMDSFFGSGETKLGID